jgi:hypothetical protein
MGWPARSQDFACLPLSIGSSAGGSSGSGERRSPPSPQGRRSVVGRSGSSRIPATPYDLPTHQDGRLGRNVGTARYGARMNWTNRSSDRPANASHAVLTRFVGLVVMVVLVAISTMIVHSVAPEFLESDPDGIAVPSGVAALVAMVAAAVVPAWRSTAQLAIGWSCAAVAWTAAIQISTGGGDPQIPWVTSIAILGLTYVLVLQPLAEFQRQTK